MVSRFYTQPVWRWYWRISLGVLGVLTFWLILVIWFGADPAAGWFLFVFACLWVFAMIMVGVVAGCVSLGRRLIRRA
jgi:4-hydroxybenzoate polyprenyltransferase